MTKNQLIKKVKSMLRDDKKHIDKLIDKAIVSGCMDIDGAKDDFTLPKQLLCAIYREMVHQRTPLDHEGKKNSENIYKFL